MSTKVTTAALTMRDGQPVAYSLDTMRSDYAEATAVLRTLARGDSLTEAQWAMIAALQGAK